MKDMASKPTRTGRKWYLNQVIGGEKRGTKGRVLGFLKKKPSLCHKRLAH